jgi:hypothetical protein
VRCEAELGKREVVVKVAVRSDLSILCGLSREELKAIFGGVVVVGGWWLVVSRCNGGGG